MDKNIRDDTLKAWSHVPGVDDIGQPLGYSVTLLFGTHFFVAQSRFHLTNEP
jgi:hypothetical protein